MNLKSPANIFNWLLDFIAPRTNSNQSSIHCYLTIDEINQQQSSFLTLDKEFTDIFETIFICSKYKSELISDLIFRAKFNGELAIIDDLVNLVDIKTFELARPDIITFVPADPVRKMERGYHIPYKIADKISQKNNLKLVEFVEKIKSTKAQTKLDKAQRLVNLKKVFRLNSEIVNDYKADYSGTIWLIDDIITTKTTMLAVAKIIKQEYPKIQIIGVGVAG